MYAPPVEVAPVAQPKPPQHLLRAVICTAVSLAIVPINTFVWIAASNRSHAFHNVYLALFVILAFAQTVLGFAGLVLGILHAVAKHPTTSERVAAVLLGLFGLLVSAGGVLGGFLGWIFATTSGLGGMGGAWGRPLRVRGRQLHPEVRDGADWTEGPRPDARDLDDATRTALEALWLHDAQKEHASVPAFSRVSWLLAAVGAPPSLVEGAHRAALEEAEHTKLCFALAAGYGSRMHTVEPMPELLLSGLGIEGRRDAYEVLAVESLEDGCLLEDFNADVAAACAAVCEEPVTRAVLLQIAREERSHAEFSWAVLGWVIERHADRLRRALHRAIARLDRVQRPTSASATLAPLVAKADVSALRRHGRLTDGEWAAQWEARLSATRSRAQLLLAPNHADVLAAAE